MIPVRQSTALELSIGPILDADGVAVTGGVVGDFKIKKTTGAFAALNASATLTHVSAGTYDLVLTTSDTDTVGLCSIAIDDTTNACAPVYLQVMEEAVYDALYAASANAWSGAAGSSIGAANVTQIGGDAQSATDLKDFADAGYDPSTNMTQANVERINNNAAAAEALQVMFANSVTVDDTSFSPTTTEFEISATTDESARYSEQTLYGITGTNAGITVRITGYSHSTRVKLTVDALPNAPLTGDTFLLIGRIEQ